MSAALPSIIAMKQSYKHSDDLDIIHKPTLRKELEACLWVAKGMAKQRKFGGEHCKRQADSGELLKLEYKEQLRLIKNITKEARTAFIEVSLNPDLEIV